MSWFSKKSQARVCTECKVYFASSDDPVDEREWPNLCAVHRAASKELYWRKRAVLMWAETAWIELELQMKADYEKRDAAQRELWKTHGQQRAAGLASALGSQSVSQQISGRSC